MIIQQFYDKGLSHASYAVITNGKMVVVDPARHPQPYYDIAGQVGAEIVGVIETHPHADFVSSHLEIHQTTGATIYASKLTGAGYPHQGFDDGDIIELGNIQLKAMNTPGHSPDSICILVIDEEGEAKAVFTGDTLFAGDVGRPDLRENAGNITAKKEELARQMYHSTRDRIMTLPETVIVYPAHGPGSLCGKNMSPDLQSTIGREIRENYALQLMDELTFVNVLLSDQPFTPKYFEADVEMNKQGVPPLRESVSKIARYAGSVIIDSATLLIDTRPKRQFNKAHLKGAINLQDGEKFETWLGSIIGPAEKFYLLADSNEAVDKMINKAAKIGYEKNITGAIVSILQATGERSPVLDVARFVEQPERYTILDVRNSTETAAGLIFNSALTIPLPVLRERLDEIPADKPIVVHCAAGYRSAAAASIIAGAITRVPVYDLGEAVIEFARVA